MGLAERRKIKALREEVLPGRVKEIEEIRGKPIPYEVDWDSLADAAARHLSFNDGVLEMHCAYAQGAGGMIGDGEIRDAL